MRTTSHLVGFTAEDFNSYVLGMKHSIESDLEKLLSKISDIRLHPLLEFALLSNGKRLRPILTVLSAQSVGGDPKKVEQLALSFELLHTATLVHDDIIDQDICRRGTKTLYSKWSAKGALLAGDALIALSVNLAADFGHEIMKILSEVGLELSDGEYIDSVLSLNSATEKQYFAKIEKKSASLFGCAARCGALAAGGTRLEVEALAKFGQHFGMAYQLNDDLDDLLAKNKISRDLTNGNVTLPILYMYHHGNDAAKELVKRNFGNRNVTLAAMKEIKDGMEQFGAIRYCRTRMAEHIEKSHSSLQIVRDSKFKNYLMQFSSPPDEFESRQG
jgi:octaprenyl-diphosphate synthase